MNTFYEINALHPDPGVGQDVLIAGVVLERLRQGSAIRGDRGLSTPSSVSNDLVSSK